MSLSASFKRLVSKARPLGRLSTPVLAEAAAAAEAAANVVVVAETAIVAVVAAAAILAVAAMVAVAAAATAMLSTVAGAGEQSLTPAWVPDEGVQPNPAARPTRQKTRPQPRRLRPKLRSTRERGWGRERERPAAAVQKRRPMAASRPR